MIRSAVCYMFTGFNDLWQKCKGRGRSWANAWFARYPSSERHDVIVALTFDLGLKTCWHLSSNQVILGPFDKKPHSLPEETGQQDEAQNVSSETGSWFVVETQRFGTSVVSFPAETDQFTPPANLMVAPDIWNKLRPSEAEQSKLHLLLFFLKLFTSASYKTWNVKRPRVNNVFLKCNRTFVFFSSVFFAQTVVASTASAACCMAVNHLHVSSRSRQSAQCISCSILAVLSL